MNYDYYFEPSICYNGRDFKTFELMANCYIEPEEKQTFEHPGCPLDVSINSIESVDNDQLAIFIAKSIESDSAEMELLREDILEALK